MTDPETFVILSDADAMRQLDEAEAEIAQGQGGSEEQLALAMQRRQFAKEAHRQSRAVAASEEAEVDQAFAESASVWPED